MSDFCKGGINSPSLNGNDFPVYHLSSISVTVPCAMQRFVCFGFVLFTDLLFIRERESARACTLASEGGWAKGEEMERILKQTPC